MGDHPCLHCLPAGRRQAGVRVTITQYLTHFFAEVFFVAAFFTAIFFVVEVFLDAVFLVALFA